MPTGGGGTTPSPRCVAALNSTRPPGRIEAIVRGMVQPEPEGERLPRPRLTDEAAPASALQSSQSRAVTGQSACEDDPEDADLVHAQLSQRIPPKAGKVGHAVPAVRPEWGTLSCVHRPDRRAADVGEHQPPNPAPSCLLRHCDGDMAADTLAKRIGPIRRRRQIRLRRPIPEIARTPARSDSPPLGGDQIAVGRVGGVLNPARCDLQGADALVPLVPRERRLASRHAHGSDGSAQPARRSRARH